MNEFQRVAQKHYAEAWQSDDPLLEFLLDELADAEDKETALLRLEIIAEQIEGVIRAIYVAPPGDDDDDGDRRPPDQPPPSPNDRVRIRVARLLQDALASSAIETKSEHLFPHLEDSVPHLKKD